MANGDGDYDPAAAVPVTGGGGGGVGNSALLDLLKKDPSAFSKLAKRAGAGSPGPGYMHEDDAKRYMARIVTLFVGQAAEDVEMALAKWAILNDVGGDQSFVDKPPITVGGVTHAATEIFGEIIPTDKRGFPRQFCATRFESIASAILDACPEVRSSLAPRAVERGLRPGDELSVISFMKGGLPGTSSIGRGRVVAKVVGISGRSGGKRSEHFGGPVVTEQGSGHETPHDLY